MLKRIKRKRRISLIITFVDFIIIFIVIFYINVHLLKTKTVKYNDLKLKYKYDKLKDNMGYIFSLSIVNNGETNKTMKKDNRVRFFIKEKENNKKIWEKHIPKPTFPIVIKEIDSIILKPDDLISYTYIYDLQNEVTLPEGEWRFGSRVTIGTDEIIMSLPRSTKPTKGIGDFFR